MITIDPRSIEKVEAMLASVDGVVRSVPIAEVYLGPRRHWPTDARRMTNEQVAAELASRGTDPMEVPPSIRGHTTRKIIYAIDRAIRGAIESGRSTGLEAALRDAISYLSEWLRGRISSGRLGMNSAATVRIKMNLIGQGLATTRYGVPPPYGISSGRFIESIQHRIRRRGSRGER